VDRRFGILTLAGGPFSELARCWREAEQLGFVSAWLVDTFSYVGIVDYEPWTLLAALARETSRLRIGTMVTHIAFRHPTVLAAQVLTVDHVSRGRVDLGIGPGGPEPRDNPAVGATDWTGRERADRLEEQLDLLDRLLRGDHVDHVGRFYRAQDVQLVGPVQRPRPRLIVAAQGPRTLRLAARYGDGWNSLGGQPQSGTGLPRHALAEAVERTREHARRLDEYCREFGRDPRDIRRSVLALRADPNPLSSVEAFDEFVGSYAEIGIEEFIFYWPPLKRAAPKAPIAPSQQAMFERIAAERIAPRRRDVS
jgi:alkanesulfonate monooxygenase SsuD/methylene tetrahydromethanopterin reductase-like flavin-dependent oxidoreductase (luciferase family)